MKCPRCGGDVGLELNMWKCYTCKFSVLSPSSKYYTSYVMKKFFEIPEDERKRMIAEAALKALEPSPP